MIKKSFILLFFFPLAVSLISAFKANAADICDVDKCRNDCNEIGLPLRSCKAPTCIPVCGPLDEPSEMFPVLVPIESSEG